MATKTFIIPLKGKGIIGNVSASELKEIGASFPIFDSFGVINGDTIIDDTYHNKTLRITADSIITFNTGIRADFDAVFESYPFKGTFVAGTGVTLSAPFGLILKNNNECRVRCVGVNSFRVNGGLSTF